MPIPDPRKQVLARGATLLLLGFAASGSALAQFCAADPIVPPCCPTPCPIFDPTRVPKLLADVTNLQQVLGTDTQIVQSMTQLGQTIGDTKAAVTTVTKQLSVFPAGISSELTAIQLGLSSNPVTALGSLKLTMFEPAGGGQGSAAQIAARTTSRTAAAQQEQIGAFATSLMKSDSLPSISALQSQLVTTASSSDQLHADLASNSTSRLALYQDVGGLHQLIAAWVSQRSSVSALKHPNIAGGTVSQLAPAVSGPETPGQSAVVSQTAQSTVDQLVVLHDSRVSAQTLLAAYPALQQTIASSGLADQFTRAAQSTLQKSLSALGAGSDATLFQVEKALQGTDTSGWLDSGKDIQTQQAAVRVFAAFTAGGSVSPSRVAENAAAGQQAVQAMSAWLDANKQSQYWAQLAQSARTSMANLDQRLGALSDRAGVDVTGASAAAVEAALLNKLMQAPSASQWQGLIAVASQDPGARSVLQRAAVR